MDEIARVLKSWVLSGSQTQMSPGATAEELADVQSALRRRFPDEFLECYSQTNGGSVLHGNIGLYPLRGAELSVATASAFLGKHEWPIPDELVVFGNNGAGSPIGLWLPESDVVRPIVVEVGEIFEPRCMAIVGTSFGRFLRGRTAYYLALLEATPAALDEIGVPTEYRRISLGDDEFDALARYRP